jgi:hypothetical protein
MGNLFLAKLVLLNKSQFYHSVAEISPCKYFTLHVSITPLRLSPSSQLIYSCTIGASDCSIVHHSIFLPNIRLPTKVNSQEYIFVNVEKRQVLVTKL